MTPEDRFEQWLEELKALRPGDPLPPENRDPLEALDDELGHELAEVVARNCVARLQHRWEDVDEERERFLTRAFLPPRPDNQQ